MLPSRRGHIPKAEESKRPLGIAAREDQIVQKAGTDGIRVPIYESEFLGFSSGFRPPRSAHQARDAGAAGLTRRRVNGVWEADLRGFLDAGHRDGLLRFRAHRLGDQRVRRRITKGLQAGGMEEGPWSDTGKGAPPGPSGPRC